MTADIEQELVRCFEHIHATTSVGDVLTRGRHLRRRRRLPTYAATLAVAATAGSLALTSLPHGQGQAFAGWRASPTLLRGAEAARIERYCRYVNGPTRPPSPYLHPSVPARVVEGRGPWGFAVFSDNQVELDCLLYLPADANFGGGSGQALTTVKHRSAVAAGTTPLAIEYTDFFNAGGTVYGKNGDVHVERRGQAASVYGWTRPDVSSVRVFSNGEEIDASVENGVFAAWWPISGPRVPPLTIKAYAHDGALLGTVSQPAGRCGVPHCRL